MVVAQVSLIHTSLLRMPRVSIGTAHFQQGFAAVVQARYLKLASVFSNKTRS